MARPLVVDLYPAEIEPDGTRVYRPPLQALAAQIASGAIYLLSEYPQQTLHIVALMLVAGACVWLCKKA